MSTNANVKFYNDGQFIANMYKHWDGYPEGILPILLRNVALKRETQGITEITTVETHYNGFGCLVAQIIKEFKQDIGDVYLEPEEVSSEFVYIVNYNKGELNFKAYHYDELIFDGDVETLIDNSEDPRHWHGL